VQEKAVQAVPAFVGEYFKDVEAEKIDQVLLPFLKKLWTIIEFKKKSFPANKSFLIKT